MTGSGQYLPDATGGITRVEDLPKPQRVEGSRDCRRRRCPYCGHSACRNRTFTRTLHDVGDLAANRPRDLVVPRSQHCCSRCRRYVNVDLVDLADPNSHYTRRVVALAVRLVVEDGLPDRSASWHLWRDHRMFVPFATVQNWVEAGKKGPLTASRRTIWTRPWPAFRATSRPTNSIRAVLHPVDREQPPLQAIDLRFTSHRARVYEHLPFPMEMSYCEKQKMLGLNIERLYEQAGTRGEVLL